MKKKQRIIAGGVLVLMCIVAALLYTNFIPETVQGEKEITVMVVHGDGKENVFTYQTDAEYLGEVLEVNKLVEGEEGQYGLFITSVDGEEADQSQEEWWCITKEGEQVNASAGQTPIQNGDQFELTLKEGYE